MWTMDELVDRTRRALAAYPGAASGRVRDVPDRRAIRWYTTTGLVDRPLGMRGRSALYGPRHLLQLVAIKRRQAGGQTLTQIQAELAGASDEALATVAAVPPHLLATDGPEPEAAPARDRFWTARPAAAAPPVAHDAASPTIVDPLGAITLGGGAILVLPHQPTGTDRAAIADAARPLLDLLAARGLLHGNTDDGSPS